jgi:multiple sugar transport system permease protein
MNAVRFNFSQLYSRTLWTIVTVAVLLLAVLALFPFVWMILTSLKSSEEINLMPPVFFPRELMFNNYEAAWMKPESTFGRYFWNTIIVAGLGTALQLIICIPIAYAISHFSFKGKGLIFMLVITTMMIPYDITLVPNFVTLRHIPFAGGNDWMGSGGKGFYDSYMGIMMPFLADAFSIFLLRQAFLSVPKDYWEASQVDGMSSFRYLYSVLIPLSASSLVTAGLLGFIGKWNAVSWPLIITSTEAIRPLQVGLLYFVSENGSSYHQLMAAATFTVLPIVLLYFAAQKWFHSGIAASGIKG